MPSSVTKMKRAGPAVLPPPSTNAADALYTIPVGLPPSGVVGVGICTTSEAATPLPSYNVDVPLPLLATHTKPNGLNARPHALTRAASVWSAATVPSETRLCCTYAPRACATAESSVCALALATASASSALATDREILEWFVFGWFILERFIVVD